MSRIREKVFISVVSNIIIFIVVASVFAISFSNKIINVLDVDATKPLYKGNAGKSYVSLNINVYWGEEYLDDILNTLKQYDVKTTFFIGGSWALKNRDMLKKIKDEGHEIANHGFYHKDHKNINADRNIEEIVNAEKVIESICGVKTKLFAPPSGAFSNTTLKIASDLGYKTIMWTLDTIDWRDKNEDLVYTRATKKIKDGDFVLMHPTAHTAKALPKILDTIINTKKLKPVTVSENINS